MSRYDPKDLQADHEAVEERFVQGVIGTAAAVILLFHGIAGNGFSFRVHRTWRTPKTRIDQAVWQCRDPEFPIQVAFSVIRILWIEVGQSAN